MADLRCPDAHPVRVLDDVKAIGVTQREQLADAIGRTVSTKGHVYFIGKGGSATTPTHYVNDLVIAYSRTNRVPRSSILTDNPALPSACAKDFAFEEIFDFPIRAIGQTGDLVFGTPESGNSPNLVRAIAYANSVGIGTAAILAFDGGKLKELVDVDVHVTTELGNYGVAKDGHPVINHAVADLLQAKGE